VLDGISGQYDAVLAWEPSTPTDPWRHWYEGAPRYVLEPTLDNALVAVDESMGLWLRTTEAVTLTVEGPELSGGYCIPLTKGWNLVGYPAQEAHFVETAMGPVLGYVEAVVADDTPDLTYNGLVWQRETYETRDDLNTLNHMQPGRGYWVNVNADCIWCVPFDGSGY